MRLIDADALHILFVKKKDFGELSAKKAIRCVEEAPTVDAVPVIRCKDCKHYMNEDENYPDEYGNCPTVCMYMPDDAEENGYCHRAERKADDER